MNRRIFLIVVSLLGFFLSLAFSLWYFADIPLTSPLSSLTTFNFINQITSRGNDKIVYGFVPYWNLDEVIIQPELTHLAYFGLTIGASGHIVTKENGGLEPGYKHLQSDKFLQISSQMEQQNKNIEIVLSQFNNDAIVTLLNQEQSIQNLLTSLDSILLAYPVNGINLDIEYTGKITDDLQQKFVKLVTAINQHLDQKYDHVAFSIDMYASAASNPQIWDVAAIEPHVDHIVVMAYDFHQRSSPQAGPVAPLFGGREYWDSDINQHLADFVKLVPKEKILLGVPFYGYEWQTTSRDPQAHTFPKTGSTASFKRVKKIMSQAKELSVEEGWNDHALSPYLSYLEDNQIFVIYYENSRSLSYKLDYVNQLNLSGISIWALGYEDDSRELWDVIDRKL
ncbi:MAG: glycosyl hydrolase family 18 protein [Patescibacteria group bacterium]